MEDGEVNIESSQGKKLIDWVRNARPSRRNVLKAGGLAGIAALLAACGVRKSETYGDTYTPRQVLALEPIDWSTHRTEEVMEGLATETIFLNGCELVFVKTEHGREVAEDGAKMLEIEKIVTEADVIIPEYMPDKIREMVGDNPAYELRGDPKNKIYPFFDKIVEMGARLGKPLVVVDPVNRKSWAAIGKSFYTVPSPDGFVEEPNNGLTFEKEKENIYRHEVVAGLLSRFTQIMSDKKLGIVYILPAVHAEGVIDEFRKYPDSRVDLDYVPTVAPLTGKIAQENVNIREDQLTGGLYGVKPTTGKYEEKDTFRIEP